MNDISTIRMTFTVRRICVPNYYSRKYSKYIECSILCKGTHTYNCDTRGFRVCKEGYYFAITSIII